MDRPSRAVRLARTTVVAGMLGGFALLAGWIDLYRPEWAVLNHLAYVPLVLAAMWWGLRALPLAALPGAWLIAAPLVFDPGTFPWTDVVRAGFYVVVTACVGWLADRLRVRGAALRASEANLQGLIENSVTGVVVYRGERILFCNACLLDLLAPDGADPVGRSIWDFIHPDDRDRVASMARARGGQAAAPLRYECRLVGPGGRTIWADLASFVIDWDGRPAVLVNVYDVTGRREAEERNRQQEEQLVHSTRLAELGEMAAAIAHELNQPLTGIRNYARNASYMIEHEAGEPGEVRENLRLISEQVDRAARIIHQMRELTRRTEREFAPVDVSGIARESLEFLSPQMRLSGIDVRLSLADDLPPVVGDRVRLEQVLLNLLANARHAMEEAPERVLTLLTRHCPGEDRPIVVEVRDTGVGFAQEDVERIFQPFYTTKKPGRGTGLGLSISLTIVREHGGTIEATGTPGRGATFTIRLPAVGGDEEAR